SQLRVDRLDQAWLDTGGVQTGNTFRRAAEGKSPTIGDPLDAVQKELIDDVVVRVEQRWQHRHGDDSVIGKSGLEHAPVTLDAGRQLAREVAVKRPILGKRGRWSGRQDYRLVDR